MVESLYGACPEWILGASALIIYKVQGGEWRARMSYGQSCRLVFAKHKTNGFTQIDAFASVGKQACASISPKNLNGIVVSASYEQILTVGCDGEVSGMNARLLVAHLGEKSRLWINREDGNAVFFSVDERYKGISHQD